MSNEVVIQTTRNLVNVSDDIANSIEVTDISPSVELSSPYVKTAEQISQFLRVTDGVNTAQADAPDDTLTIVGDGTITTTVNEANDTVTIAGQLATSSRNGLIPNTPQTNANTYFLRGDLAWIQPQTGGTVTSVDINASGGLTASGGPITTNGQINLTINDGNLPYQKIQNVTATNRILGRKTTGAGTLEELTPADVRTMVNVEDGATADQTASEIKTAYESNSDTNALTDALLSKINGLPAGTSEFTTAEKTKLAGIETGATADQTGSEIKSLYEGQSDTNAFTDALLTKLNGVETSATADQTGSEIKTLYEGENDTNAFTDTLLSKLNGIETNATADLTGAEIKSLYESQSNTNAFTDAEKTKIANLPTGTFATVDDVVALSVALG